ncbi:hypothetical protein ACWENQ_40895 [Nonomuraea sp. NPDC004354]
MRHMRRQVSRMGETRHDHGPAQAPHHRRLVINDLQNTTLNVNTKFCTVAAEIN